MLAAATSATTSEGNGPSSAGDHAALLAAPAIAQRTWRASFEDPVDHERRRGQPRSVENGKSIKCLRERQGLGRSDADRAGHEGATEKQRHPTSFVPA